MPTSERKSKSISDSEILLRNSMWPDADQRLWKHKEAGGFFTVPKTMPYIARLLDETAKNTPLSSTYQALWSFTWSNDGFVKLGKILDVVYAAGFNGERGIRTLKERLARLQKLGFIELQKTGGDQLGFVYIPNPHRVIIEAMRSDKPPFRQDTYSSFIARALEVGAQDVKALLAETSAPEEIAVPSSKTPSKKPTPKRAKLTRLPERPLSS